jgi:2-dehydro-3-deoxyphosphogluconate aldolase/(4S)-4-hydroxy-2-oxoglutarate aldolase
MDAILEDVGKVGIVPVIKIDDVDKAVPLAKALLAGGIPCIEITFRTAQGEEALRRITKSMPEMLLGAGTILTPSQVDKAIEAGAEFIVSPGLNPKVVAHCQERKIPIVPGCLTPSDIEQAIEFNLDVVKIFPAEQAGGIDYIKAIAAPFPNMRFIPTDDFSTCDIAKYMSFDKVLACGSSLLPSASFIEAGEFEKITAQAQDAVLNLLSLRIDHIGINGGGEERAMKASKIINAMFGLPMENSKESITIGSGIKVFKTGAHGTHGHIGISTNNLSRTLGHFERNGVPFDYDTAKRNSQGVVTEIYLKKEMLGFAILLMQAK